MKVVSSLCSALLSLPLSATAVLSQTAPAPSPAVSALEEQKKIIELKRDIEKAEAERSALKLGAAADGRGPLEGKIELTEKALYLAEWQMYQAIDAVAERVATHVESKIPGNPGAKSVVLSTDPAFAQAAAQGRALTSSIKVWTDEIAKANTELSASVATGRDCKTAGPAVTMGVDLGTVSAAFGGLSNLVGYFQSDYALGTTRPEPNQSAWLAVTAGHLTTKGVTVRTHQLGSLGPSTLLRDVEALLKDAETVRKSLSVLNTWLPASPKTPPKTQPAANPCIDDRRALVAGATDTLKRFDAFIASIIAPGEKGAPSLLERAVAAGPVNDIGSMILITSIVSNGGIQSVRRSLWSSPRIAYVGAAVVSYTLLDADNKVVTSGIDREATNLTVRVSDVSQGKTFKQSSTSE